MGCCLSAAAPRRHRPPKAEARHLSPPPAFEEETVKEVLSETPIMPRQPPPETPPPPVEDGRRKSLHSLDEVKAQNDLVLSANPAPENQENVSELSEMYSYSESFSAATTVTVTDAKRDDIEIDDDDGEVAQKVNISPAVKRVVRKRPTMSSGELVAKKDRCIRTPARRSVIPSPEKKSQPSSRTTTMAQRHWNVGPSNVSRREIPARRSRSQAMRGEASQRRDVRGRSPAGKSRHRSNVDEKSPPEKSGDGRPVDAGNYGGMGVLEKAGEGGGSPEPEPVPETSESLENPLVSMECFIFL